MRFFTERERPIHLSKLPVLAAMPKRFCNNRETSELFHLGSIILYLRLRGTYSSATPCTVNVQVQTSVPRCIPHSASRQFSMDRAGHSQPARFADDKSRPATDSEGQGAPPKLADASHNAAQHEARDVVQTDQSPESP